MSIFHTPVTYPIIIPNIANKDFQQIQYCVNVFSIYDRNYLLELLKIGVLHSLAPGRK